MNINIIACFRFKHGLGNRNKCGLVEDNIYILHCPDYSGWITQITFHNFEVTKKSMKVIFFCQLKNYPERVPVDYFELNFEQCASQ